MIPLGRKKQAGKAWIEAPAGRQGSMNPVRLDGRHRKI
jgi:hypothetical protein